VSFLRWMAVIASAVLAAAVAACGSDDDGSSGGSSSSLSGQIAGAGATSQEAAQEAWIAEFENENSGATISYDPVGSGDGRAQFAAGDVAYAGTDAPLDEEEGELTKAFNRCNPGFPIEIPAYVSPIAIVYNLDGVESLQLSPETLAKIFKQEITSWDDKAIAADNPGVELPSTRITPVNRSDESGTTENFTDYLSQVVPSVWTYKVNGDWPVKGGEAAQGTSGVVEAVAAGEGAIGYADAGGAGELGVASIKVGKEYVEPTPEAAAKILEESPPDKAVTKASVMFPFKLNRKTESSGTYPIVLVSYLLACTQYGSTAEAAVAKAYLEYVISPEGQELAAEKAGSAPLSASLTKTITPPVEFIEGP
jgi:phosphate transport system substrate-binding protein